MAGWVGGGGGGSRVVPRPSPSASSRPFFQIPGRPQPSRRSCHRSCRLYRRTGRGPGHHPFRARAGVVGRLAVQAGGAGPAGPGPTLVRTQALRAGGRAGGRHKRRAALCLTVFTALPPPHPTPPSYRCGRRKSTIPPFPPSSPLLPSRTLPGLPCLFVCAVFQHVFAMSPVQRSGSADPPASALALHRWPWNACWHLLVKHRNRTSSGADTTVM